MSTDPPGKPPHVSANPSDRDPLEIAIGLPIGTDPAVAPLPDPGAASAREVLEAELIPALARPPCVVSFSGGRDCSAMLALATYVARREGLPDPIAISWRFPAHPSTDESRWQEQVVAALRLREWEILTFNDELEVLGELATGLLRRHRQLWPTTTHLIVPALTYAQGGSLLATGQLRGLFDRWRFARASEVMRGRVRPEPRDAGRVAVALLPRNVRMRVGRADTASRFPWLRPEAQRMLFERMGGRFDMPRRWDQWLAWFWSQRIRTLAEQSLTLVAREHAVEPFHPLSSQTLLAALAKEGGAWGLGGRPGIMHQLFGGLVPDEVLKRPRTRAEYGDVLWAGRSRAFARSWDGSGVDHELVDIERLRALWTGPRPWLYYSAANVAQSAWLASTDS